MQVDLIVKNIGQLVTCASPREPKRGHSMRDVNLILDGAVAVSGGRFVGTGASKDILVKFNSHEVIDASGRVVCPGFVDPHTHIVFAGDRLNEFEQRINGADYLEILKNGGGIISTVRDTRKASAKALVELGLQRLDKMLAAGTTACEIKTGYGLDKETELKMLDVIALLDAKHSIHIVPTFLAAHAIPKEFKDKPDEYVDLICTDMLPLAWNWFTHSHFYGDRSFFLDVFCERNAFDLGQTRRILETAKHLGFALKAHVDEFSNLGGSRLAIDLGATSIDHLDTISDKEVKLLAKSKTVGVVTPTVNFNLGSSQFADARKLVDAGCAVALSTDFNPGSAPCASQPMAMAIACRYQKLSPAEAMNAATINAAHAAGLGASRGSIELGKSADFVMLDTHDYRSVAYEFGHSSVSQVFVDGKMV